MFHRLIVVTTLSCLSLFGQNDNSAEGRLNFAEGVTRRYKTTGADKEFGNCIVDGPENKTLIHMIPEAMSKNAMMLLAHKETHIFLYNIGFSKVEFRINSKTIVLGATITPTGFILYNTTKEIPGQTHVQIMNLKIVIGVFC